MSLAATPTFQDVEEIRAGVPVQSFVETAEALGLPVKTLAGLVGLSTRTLMRKKAQHARLDREQSEKALRVRRVVALAGEVFGGADAATDWLTQPAVALEGRTPLSLLDTGAGEQIVVNVLGAIEHGIYL